MSGVWYLLLGVVATTLLQLARELVLERRREQRAADGERRRIAREDEVYARDVAREEALYEREARSARRQVADELETLARHLGTLRQKGRWPDFELAQTIEFLPMARWEEHRGVLASLMPNDAEYMYLAELMYDTKQLKVVMKTQARGIRLDNDDMSRLANMVQRAEALHQVVLGGHRLRLDSKGEVEPVAEELNAARPEEARGL